MPAFSAVQTPTELSSGDKLAVLNAENLALNALTMAVSLAPQPTPIVLAIYNNSGQAVTLVASPDLTAADYLPVTDTSGVAVAVAAASVVMAEVAPGLQYAVKAGAAITAGTIWLAR
jgi:hypothetical protein